MKSIRLGSFLIPLIAPALAAVALSSCNSNDSAGAASLAAVDPVANVGSGSDSSGDPAPAPSATPTTNPSIVGDSCEGNTTGKTCLAMHFVTYTDSSGNPTATKEQAATIIRTMNQLYSQCNIAFEIEKYDPVDPTKSGLSYGAQSQNELDAIRQTYAQPTNELLGVTTGPWGTAVNGWTNMPGGGIYGAIMEASIVDYAGGIIYAHEFGHYLGLDHVSDSSNLMSPLIYTSSTNLTSSQCQEAQNVITQYWSAMIRK
jgi:hypothetical protein